ncbi:App1 family protein [Mongoliibacter ruber]|uniref:Phosphatidate phosphatase APP1 n=1 Tax=Mongoliibacter ruber TaxID=1750599 RepID=A0A2T0WR46_9BACT|nr:phosphatase domain-containing protein [Mongoliibacter ruber]PRY89171.1 phosphatidate phosphatase APP1 [Mongoliibacter ruber]
MTKSQKSFSKSIVLPILYGVKRRFSKAKLWVGIKTGIVKSIMILPYKGFGNENEIFLIGRVLKDRGIGISNLDDSRWLNFKKMYKRFMTWEIPRVKVKAMFQGLEQIVSTDDEGYFEVRIQSDLGFEINQPWQEVELELLDQVVKNQKEVKSKALVFIPSGNVEYGVISDIDDTIVPTGATRIWEMLKTTFLGNAHTRLPFAGVGEFYRSLSKGTDGVESNPFFYVSSSPWNLYDFLMEFLEVHGIPKGPLMLRDLGLSREQFFAGSHSEHKLFQVEKIFEIEKQLQFILIGDSGQHDPEIYLQAIKEYPGKVKMVYIRDVLERREKEVLEIAREMEELGVEMILVKDTVEAALHAKEKGWIWEEDVRDIIAEKEAVD